MWLEGGGGKLSHKKGWGRKCDFPKIIGASNISLLNFQSSRTGARDIIGEGGANATLPSLSLKYSIDHAYEFLCGLQHSQTSGVIDMVFCVISWGSRVSVLLFV